MAFERFFLNTRSEHFEGVMLQEYAGRWYLVDAARSKAANGTVYKKHGYRTITKNGKTTVMSKDDGTPQNFPWSVCIGHDAEQAANLLRAILDQLPVKGE